MKRRDILSMIRNHKHIIGAFLLLVLLGTPYAIFKIARLEPYPAILLPAGAGKILKKGNSFQFARTGIYGIDLVSGEWQRLDPASFLDPIPAHFLNAIIVNEFGLNPDLEFTVRFRGNLLPSFSYDNRSRLSEKNINDTKSWLRTRLSNHGSRDEMLLVRKVLISVNLKTREISETGILYEKTYECF